MYPLTLAERAPAPASTVHSDSPLPLPWPRGTPQDNLFPPADLETRLIYGELPGVVTAPKADRAGILRAYAFVHLEEERRREALVKDWAAFVRFLRLAALESGQVLNYAAISNETGISQPTVKGYYQLLEDMFIGVRVLAWTKSPPQEPAFYAEISSVRSRRAPCGRGIGSFSRDHTQQSRPTIRAMGGVGALAAAAIPRSGRTVLPAHARWSGSRFHRGAQRPGDPI